MALTAHLKGEGANEWEALPPQRSPGGRKIEGSAQVSREIGGVDRLELN